MPRVMKVRNKGREWIWYVSDVLCYYTPDNVYLKCPNLVNTNFKWKSGRNMMSVHISKSKMIACPSEMAIIEGYCT